MIDSNLRGPQGPNDTGFNILARDIGDDFIGVWDTDFDGEYLTKFFDRVESANQCFRRQEASEVIKVDDTAYGATCYPEGYNLPGMPDQRIYFDNQFVEVYNQVVSKCLDEYCEKYAILQHIEGVQYGVNIQKTKPGEGYHIWHSEIEGKIASARLLVTTLFLNDVEEGGETEFLYQHKRIRARNGRCMIFPAQWPHTHRGNPPLSGDKYIATSWIQLRK
jgi:hypothetical protein